MRGMVFEKFGGPEVLTLKELPQPIPQENEVLVRVVGVAVNPVDTFIRSGRFSTKLAAPQVIGRDLVGEVVAKGSAVTTFQTGDWVWSNSMGYDGRIGATAELVAVPKERLYPVPVGVDPLKLVASVHPGAIAAILLQNVLHVVPGKTLLVTGAAGHVGTKLVRLAAVLGLRVVTTAAPADFSLLQSLGAKNCYDYHDFRAKIKKDYPEGFDYLVDTSGGVPLAVSMELLAFKGTIGMITTPPPAAELPDFAQFYMADRQLLGFVISHATAAELAEAAELLNSFFRRGELLTEKLFIKNFAEASTAHQLLEQHFITKERFVLIH